LFDIKLHREQNNYLTKPSSNSDLTQNPKKINKQNGTSWL